MRMILFFCLTALTLVAPVEGVYGRGMYCTRHRAECRNRDRRAALVAVAALLAQEEYNRWYATLKGKDKIIEDQRVYYRTAMLSHAARLRYQAQELRMLVFTLRNQ